MSISRRRPLRYASTALILLFLSAGLLFGQAGGSRGDITGTVFDPSGAAVPNAAVTATNTATGLSRQATANSLGQYRLLRLDPGTYVLSANNPGFAVSNAEGVVLGVGSSISVNLTLQVQPTTTTVNVSASLIEVSDAPSTGVPETAILNLPINGRRFQDFATLTPTVQIEPERSTLSFASQRGVNGNVMVDGADYNNPFFGGIRGGERANLVFTVPQSSVEEFEVVTTGYSPEYGRSTGGLLNVITRTGRSEYHGGFFWQYRDGDLSMREPIQNRKSAETQHQFGGNFGGPIVPGRWFTFTSLERQQADAPRQVLFTRLEGVTPAADQQEAFSFYKAQEGPFELTNNATAFTTRLDYQSTAGNRATLRYNFSDANGENAVNTGNSLDPTTNRALSNDGIEKDRTNTGIFSLTNVISPTILNDFKFNFTHEQRPRLANSTQPNLDFGLIGNTGNRSFLPTTERDYRIQLTDSLSWIHGAHTMKFGADYNFVNATQTFGFNQFGVFRMSVSGSAAAAALTTLEVMGVGGATANRLDHPGASYSLQIGNLEAEMSMTQAAFFVQDSWKATRDLTLNFGVRWEGQYNPQPEATNSALVDIVRSQRSVIGAELDPTQIPNATDQWMPRLGFSWSPSALNRRLVVRGHTGLFYASSPLLLFADASNNFRATPGNLSVTLTNFGGMTVYDQFLSVGVDLNDYSLTSLPVLTPDQVTQAYSNARGIAPNPFAGAAVGFVAKDFRNPRSFQIGLGADTEITSNTVVGVQANYVNTVHLQRNRDHNMPAPFLRPTDASLRPFYGLRSRPRPFPSLGAFNVRESSGRSMYRGITFKVEHRAANLTVGSFYTLAQSFSDDDNERSATGFQALDQFDLKQDYGYSRIDIRHMFNNYAVYMLPLGFTVSGTFVARSGLPVNPTASGDPNEDFASFSDRPYEAPGVPFERMSFRNRSVITANNLRVLKRFNLGERSNVELSAEMFNLFNLDNVVYGSNFGDDNYGLGIGLDGQPVAVDPGFRRLRRDDGTYDTANRQEGTPFQAQFGFRLTF